MFLLPLNVHSIFFFTILNGTFKKKKHNCMMSVTSVHLPFIIKNKLSGSIIPSLLIQGFFLLNSSFNKRGSTMEISFQFHSSNLSVFFPSSFQQCFRVRRGLLLGGHCSTISSALENFSGSRRERQGGSRLWMGVSSAASLH